MRAHNPNPTALKLDSVEVWSESRVHRSMVACKFQPLAMQPQQHIYVYLPERQKPIQKGKYAFRTVRSMADLNLRVAANGDAVVTQFFMDQCPTCKRSAAAPTITDTVRFMLIFHHGKASDSLPVITDASFGLGARPPAVMAGRHGWGGERFDFLGRRERILGFQPI